MIKANIDTLILILQEAKTKGCEKVKLQLYDDWEKIRDEQKKPSLPIREYMIDTRFYNTIEFETIVEGNVATEEIRTHFQDKTFVIRTCLSDMETLLNGIGMETNN